MLYQKAIFEELSITVSVNETLQKVALNMVLQNRLRCFDSSMFSEVQFCQQKGHLCGTAFLKTCNNFAEFS
jgi:hypothetical protein